MAEVKINRKRQEQDDFFKSYQQGADIKAKQELLKIKQQEMQMDFVQQIMKQKAESQKLNIDMMKAGINPGRAGQTRVGSFDPFTGKQVPGGVMHDPGTQGNVFQGTVGMGGGTSVHRKPQAQKTLSPRDLSDLSFAMGDESVKPFVMQVLKERGVDPSVLKQFEQQAAAQTQVEPTQSTGKAGKRRDARATGRLFNVLYKRAGITASGCHILRHSFATHFQGREKALQRVLGHSDPRTTQRYSHVTPEELAAVKDLEY